MTKTVFRVRWGALAASILAGLMFSLIPIAAITEATPCTHEDDTFCHWDAQHQGNGSGRSFTTYWEGFTVQSR